MKTLILSVLLSSIMLPIQIYANGGPYPSGVREAEQLEKEERMKEPEDIRENAAKNPRNRAFPESFERVDESRQEEQERNVEDLTDKLRNDPLFK